MEPLSLVPNLIEQVHGRLTDAIADGTLVPGERLTQEEVADRLGVSRQPVSHALQLLKRQGLVVEHGRGRVSVAPVEPERMRDLYQLRAAIDGLACRLAAERVAAGGAPAAEVRRLREWLAAGQALAPDATVREWIEADVAFHQSIYALSGNTVIAETVAERWPHFKRCMGTSLSSDGVRRAVWAEHAEIAGAILSGAARAAEGAVVHHAEKAGANLYRRLTTESDRAGSARRA
jgi:DNA-binding GntR family transcriptional regulator